MMLVREGVEKYEACRNALIAELERPDAAMPALRDRLKLYKELSAADVDADTAEIIQNHIAALNF